MKYTENMNLQSRSGYCMPFEERNGRVEILHPYGDDGKGNFNHGVDFKTDNYLIAAMADGQVIGAMNGRDGASVTFQHGDYMVTYRGLGSRFAQIDQKVKAGMVVATSRHSLRVEVAYKDEEVNPMEFLTMIYGNIKMLEQTGRIAVPEFETIDMDVPTEYDDHAREIEQLMYRYLPGYFADLKSGEYLLPVKTEMSLRNTLSWAAIKNFFFRRIPHLGNPGGLDESAVPLACKVQNLLIGDFLNYLALKRQIYLSAIADELKKKSMNAPY